MTNPIVRTGSSSLLYDVNNLNLDISPNNAKKLAEIFLLISQEMQ